jgi:transcriptional regulator with XRE-family HTH domain
MLLRRKRERDNLTLKDVADRTGLKIPTISRVERGAAQDLESGTFLTLANWLDLEPKDLLEGEPLPLPPVAKSKVTHTTPDVVELYLRADKDLDKTTATALSTMFRTAYEMMSKRMPAKRG